MKKTTSIVIQISILVLCVAAVVWTLASLGMLEVWSALSHADPWWFALSFIPILGRFVIWSAKWDRMLRREGSVSRAMSLRTVLAGAFVNLTTPTAKLGGGVLRTVLVHRHTGWRLSRSYGWNLADQVTNTLGNTALFGVLAWGTWMFVRPESGTGFLFVAGGTALVIPLAFLLFRQKLWRGVQNPKLERLWVKIVPARFRSRARRTDEAPWPSRVFGPLLGIGTWHRETLTDLALAAASFSMLCVANAMVLRSFDVQAPLLLLATVLIIGYFAGTTLGTMGGIGATELFLIHLYTMAGIENSVAGASALLHRASYYAVTLIFGGAALWWETRRSTHPKPSDHDPG